LYLLLNGLRPAQTPPVNSIVVENHMRRHFHKSRVA
jgi:hypothetical protein